MYTWLIVPVFRDISFLFTPGGSISVYIFYLLSGYGVGYGFFSGRYGLRKHSLLTFYKKRLLRIAPAYFLCLIISILVVYKDTPIRPYDIYRFFTFTGNVDYLNLPYLQLFAIISTEMQFYLLAPLLFVIVSFVLKKTHVVVGLIGAIALGYSVRYFLHTHGFILDGDAFRQNIYVNPLAMIDYFLVGMLISSIMIKQQHFVHLIKKTKIIFFVFASVFFLWTNYETYSRAPFDSFLAAHMYVIPLGIFFFIGWFILLFGKTKVQPPSLIRLIKNPFHIFHILGVVSFGLFLWHTPITHIINTIHITKDQHIFVHFSLLMVVTTFVSFVSYYLIEKPLMKK